MRRYGWGLVLSRGIGHVARSHPARLLGGLEHSGLLIGSRIGTAFNPSPVGHIVPALSRRSPMSDHPQDGVPPVDADATKPLSKGEGPEKGLKGLSSVRDEA